MGKLARAGFDGIRPAAEAVPELAFVLAANADGRPQPRLLAASTARLFLGVQIECAQCHNHPLARWKRSEFWAFAAFFERVRYPQAGKGDDFIGPVIEPETGKRLEYSEKGRYTAVPAVRPEPEIEIADDSTGTGKFVRARFLGGAELPPGARGPFRKTLVGWMTAADNPYFARAAANRVWAQLMGRGLVEPVDDMQEDNPATHPDALRALADEFGRGCLLARRLVEAGVSFVEVSWGGRGTVAWDSHGGGAEAVKKKSPALDAGFGTLVRDLKDRGLLDTTLVVWMGEFGRGPRPGQGGGINGGIGSGHFAKCWATVLTGAGIKAGQVVGKPSKDLCEPEETPVSAADFFASVMKAIGIGHTRSTTPAGGRSRTPCSAASRSPSCSDLPEVMPCAHSSRRSQSCSPRPRRSRPTKNRTWSSSWPTTWAGATPGTAATRW